MKKCIVKNSGSYISSAKSVMISSVLPFWRYAVGLRLEHMAAVSFHTEKSAIKSAKIIDIEFPMAGTILYKRVGFRSVEIIGSYIPKPKKARAK